MTKYILHGGFERQENDLNISFYKELAEGVPDGATFLLVYFAVTYDEVQEAFDEQSVRIKEIIGRDLKFVLASEDDFMDQVKEASIIHFRGGHTPKLLEALKRYPELGAALESKVVSGSSAGAYALAKYGPGHSQEGIREGLGLVPVRVVCHYQSPELPPNPESYAELLTIAPELELVQLKDFEWKVFNI